MTHLLKIGRLFLAAPLLVFAIQYLAIGKYQGGLAPMPPWAPGGAAGAYLVGLLLLVTGAAILINKQARLLSLVTGAWFVFSFFVFHLQHASSVWGNGTDRTRAFETLCIGVGLLALAAMSPAEGFAAMSAEGNRKVIVASRIVFGVSMVIFGWQHFMYAQFLVTLVQKWLPFHAFWIYFTGTAMMAAGAAIGAGILARLAGIWLAIMFVLWFLTLHLPRVLAAIRNQDELTSMFVALAFSGISLMFAASASTEK
ncbi:MAG TPA: hypothetical protein VMP12_06695 [Candidatus Sulfotelmatobacter sp.]|nr:hypothetical protein [Candidatus Sulfotelmatobacter sp.]